MNRLAQRACNGAGRVRPANTQRRLMVSHAAAHTLWRSRRANTGLVVVSTPDGSGLEVVLSLQRM
jgi:hypothetical protein